MEKLERITVYATESEKKRIKELAKEARMSVTNFMVRESLKGDRK